MSEQLQRLREVIQEAVGKILKYQDRNLGEQNTKATLIDPVLESLGWNVRDPDEVYREFKPTTRDSPVDYALTILRKPRLFVEAKGLGETLSDRKWIAQVLGYATVAGVEWCVLTDGDEYRFYNATAPLDAEEKLFRSVRLTADEPSDVVKTLTLISRANMEENILDVIWSAHYVDRRVKSALQDMFSTADRSLVRIIRHREPKLTPKDIVESLRRLDIKVESVTPLPAPPTRKSSATPRQIPTKSTTRRGTAPKKSKARFGVSLSDVIGARESLASPVLKGARFGVSLSDVIGAGLLSPPVRLFRKYKGQVSEATLLPDGAVEFRGERYESCSTAAEAARSAVTGRKMNTNGWVFWQYLDAKGKKTLLMTAREKYLKTKEGR